MGRGAVGSSEDVACTVVGIGVGGVTRRAEQLAMVVIGVGNSSLPGSSVGGDVTHAVIGITILQPAAGHGCHLQGGLGAVNIPVGILPGDGAAGNGSQPPQTIVAHGQGGSYTGGHGVQAAVGKVVDIPFGICRAVYLPTLTRQLVIGIVALARSQTGKAVFLLLAVDQTANGIIGVQVGYRIAVISFRQAVKLAFTVVDIGQDPAVIIGSRFRPPQVVIGEADFCTVTVGLPDQWTKVVGVNVCGQGPAAHLGGEHIAKAVVGEAVGLGFSIIGSLDRG